MDEFDDFDEVCVFPYCDEKISRFNVQTYSGLCDGHYQNLRLFSFDEIYLSYIESKKRGYLLSVD